MKIRWPIFILVICATLVILLIASRAQPTEARTSADRAGNKPMDVAKSDNLCRPSLTQLLRQDKNDPTKPLADLFDAGNQSVDAPNQAAVAMRARSTRINFDKLGWQVGAAIQLNLFDDAKFTAVLDRVESNSPGVEVWIGHLGSVPDSAVLLAVNGDIMIGNITAPGFLYEIRYTGTTHAIYQIDQRTFPPEAEPIPVELKEVGPIDPSAAPADSCTSIDVMVVYDAAARSAAGGTAAMQALINLAVSETNTGYGNSGVTQRINLVHMEEVSYDETSFDWNTALNRLTSTSDGYMDNVHTLRNAYHADETVLLVSDTAYCGLAWLMTTVSPSFATNAFAVVSQSCATGYYSFAHEMGHNMGSHHDRANASGSAAYSYSYGYQAPDKSFRTIMAYNCTSPGCPRINYWSNPDVNYNGQPTGELYTAPNSADNRRSLNNTNCTVANWRLGAAAPNAPTGLSAAAVSNSQIDLSWTDNSSDETGFKIERSPDGSTGWTQIATVGVNVHSYSNTGLTCETPYYYRVRAYNATGDSGYSNTANATTRWCPAVCTPDYTIQCGDAHNGNNSNAGSTNLIPGYSCSSRNESGPEYTYTFVPTAWEMVQVQLTNVISGDLDIFVNDSQGEGCTSDKCVAYGDSTASFFATQGRTYYFVVDGYQGAVSDYTLTVTCIAYTNQIYLPLIRR